MNKNIEILHAIAAKKSRKIIGLMSGTSLDGLDIALCDIEGSGKGTILKVTHFTTTAYTDDFRREIRAVFSKEMVPLKTLCLLHKWVANQHAAMVNEALHKWQISPSTIDLIASHGQTIYHAPLSMHGLEKYGNGTLQIGDADHIAFDTGIITISDFRQKHIAAGGEGAPLSAYGDYLLFQEKDADVVLLNIGGISNISFLPKDENHVPVFSSDLGPGNTLMDAWTRLHYPEKTFDKNADIAKAGKINDGLLSRLNDHPFIRLPLPKTTGPESFHMSFLQDCIHELHNEALTNEDVMATLSLFTATCIADAINPLIKNRTHKIYVSGGGIHNPVLMGHLKNSLQTSAFSSTQEKGIDPDAKEAVLFALLANECVSGNAETFGTGRVNFPSVSMGKISFPR